MISTLNPNAGLSVHEVLCRCINCSFRMLVSSAVLTADVKSLGLGTISGDGKVQKGKRVKKKKKEREGAYRFIYPYDRHYEGHLINNLKMTVDRKLRF